MVDPTVRMRMLQLCGAAGEDVFWLLFYGVVAVLYLGLSLSLPTSPLPYVGVVRITQGWLKAQFYLIQPLVPL